MKKFIWKSLALIFLTFICHLVFNKMMELSVIKEMSQNETLKKYYSQNENTLDLVFLGSSHGYCSFRPDIINKNLGIRGFNLCSDAQSFANSYLTLKYLLKKHKPKVLIQEVYYCLSVTLSELKNGSMAMNEHCKLGNEIYSFLSRSDKIKLEINYIDFDLILNSLLTSLRGGTRIKNIDGYKFFENKVSSGVISSHVTNMYNLNEIFYQKSIFLDKIQKLCKKNGIKLILVTAPFLDIPSNYDKISSYYTEYSSKIGVDYYDFNNKIIDFAPLDDFKDLGHLNTNGATKISEYISEHILKKEMFFSDR